MERQNIRASNHAFYCKLIDGLENFHEEDIPTTVYILEEIKRVFETEYMLTEEILNEIIEAVNGMKIDHKTEDILHVLADFVGISLNFTQHD